MANRYIIYFHLCVVHSVSVWPYGSNLIEWDLSPLGRILSCRARDTVCGVGESEENKDEGENSEDEMSVWPSPWIFGCLDVLPSPWMAISPAFVHAFVTTAAAVIRVFAKKSRVVQFNIQRMFSAHLLLKNIIIHSWMVKRLWRAENFSDHNFGNIHFHFYHCNVTTLGFVFRFLCFQRWGKEGKEGEHKCCVDHHPPHPGGVGWLWNVGGLGFWITSWTRLKY